MHPECPPEALALADMTGSTAAIIEYIRGGGDDVIVATERGVVDRLEPAYPGRLHQLCEEKLICPDMKRTTLESLLAAMEGGAARRSRLEEGLAAAARHSLRICCVMGDKRETRGVSSGRSTVGARLLPAAGAATRVEARVRTAYSSLDFVQGGVRSRAL